MKTDIRHIIANATLAARSWATCAARERSRRLRGLRYAIAQRRREILQAIVEDTGKPVTEVVTQEVMAALGFLSDAERSYPRWLRSRRFRYLRPGFWMKAHTVVFEPLGVVAVIGPGNFPFSLPIMQSASALLCGNVVIMKPSEQCPRTTELLERVVAESGLPAGVLQVAAGGKETGEFLIADEAVRKVLFTGSYETGSDVAVLCARHLKPSVLELGGDGAALVCDDAALSRAANGIVWSAFYANGRSCVGTKRVFVHESVAETFLAELRKGLHRVKIGAPEDSRTEIGPMARREPVERYVRDAMGRGARVFVGAGQELAGTQNQIEAPIVIWNDHLGVSPDREMGDVPVLTVRLVKSDDQAVAEANASSFGLGASVWTRSRTRGRSLARRLEVGMVWINDCSAGEPGFPWGGLKKSGWGRLLSRESIHELTNVKVVSYERGRGSRSKIWWFPYSQLKLDLFDSVNESFFGSPSWRGLLRVGTTSFRYAVDKARSLL